MSFSVRPLHDRIVVKRDEPKDVTPNGIVLPGKSQEKPRKGTVVAVGTGRITEAGNTIPLHLKVGDRIIFGHYAGSEIEVEGEKYQIMREGDVSAVVENETADGVDAGTSTGRRDTVSTFYQ